MMAVRTLFILALILHSRPILGMLDCDPSFVKNVDQHLNAKVPADAAGRPDLLEGVKKGILGVYRSAFKDTDNLRIIDIRSVEKLRKTVLDNLKKVEYHGVKTFLADITRLKQELMQQMKQSLQDFADLACSEDCSVIEGPVLDSRTCLRIRAHCFKGSVCGEKEDFVAEKRHLIVYLCLVVEFVIAAAILVACYLYYKVKMASLRERERKKDPEAGGRNV